MGKESIVAKIVRLELTIEDLEEQALRMTAAEDMRQRHGAVLQRIGTALGLLPGTDLHTECVPAILAMKAQLAGLRRRMASVADMEKH